MIFESHLSFVCFINEDRTKTDTYYRNLFSLLVLNMINIHFPKTNFHIVPYFFFLYYNRKFCYNRFYSQINFFFVQIVIFYCKVELETPSWFATLVPNEQQHLLDLIKNSNSSSTVITNKLMEVSKESREHSLQLLTWYYEQKNEVS